jgi:hypothetical protein
MRHISAAMIAGYRNNIGMTDLLCQKTPTAAQSSRRSRRVIGKRRPSSLILSEVFLNLSELLASSLFCLQIRLDMAYPLDQVNYPPLRAGGVRWRTMQNRSDAVGSRALIRVSLPRFRRRALRSVPHPSCSPLFTLSAAPLQADKERALAVEAPRLGSVIAAWPPTLCNILLLLTCSPTQNAARTADASTRQADSINSSPSQHAVGAGRSTLQAVVRIGDE